MLCYLIVCFEFPYVVRGSVGWKYYAAPGRNQERERERICWFPRFPMFPHASPCFPMLPHASPCLPMPPRCTSTSDRIWCTSHIYTPTPPMVFTLCMLNRKKWFSETGNDVHVKCTTEQGTDNKRERAQFEPKTISDLRSRDLASMETRVL